MRVNLCSGLAPLWIASNPAQYVRRPKVHPSVRRGLDWGELGRSLFTAERFDHTHNALAVLLGLNGLRVSEACGANIEDMAVERGHRVLRIVGKGNQPAPIPLVPRPARTIGLAVGERLTPGQRPASGGMTSSTQQAPIRGTSGMVGGPRHRTVRAARRNPQRRRRSMPVRSALSIWSSGSVDR
jgi:integrase